MNLNEYQILASRSCNDLGDLRLNLSHMVMGIHSEQEEFVKAIVNNDKVNAREEQADMMFYIANYCNFRKISLGNIVQDVNNIQVELDEWEYNASTFEIYSSRLSDIVKKFVAYGKPLDIDAEIRCIRNIMYSLTIEDTEFDFDRDLQNNIDKLKVRYPEKFTSENALNRDLDKEREILERT